MSVGTLQIIGRRNSALAAGLAGWRMIPHPALPAAADAHHESRAIDPADKSERGCHRAGMPSRGELAAIGVARSTSEARLRRSPD